ncbi:tRNA threonylcarbamoyladenosine biosynthesis protein TsaE [Mariprofundus aestuarium]|uniref:tRNA threonylcarbamoyladenosine biosynthesis protein TsaE n=1 Tax=Mariprofundus aestuarium TaxID=1921086 RepID=A0A2K8KVW0_MARES|nr:tRNA (adenosine(37)-N6)-threonylcarbamoyltransferase complex ATPase subunit type 1 TsaE [Mariprofundus aestuarium]ATX78985.1 tRNA threonylcarbamoyladenosine biosynthesis protein TsaE [Mariprofundus aestuarium]
MKIACNSEAETVAVAQRFAATLKPGDVVALFGDLGAGKSFFSRAVMRALGVTDAALPSPTFAIIQEYEAASCRVAHMDWYRLEDADEIEMLGVRDYFQPPWVTLIEWPERAKHALPNEVVRVSFRTTGIESREVEFGNSTFD